jgi:hypothetical protein
MPRLRGAQGVAVRVPSLLFTPNSRCGQRRSKQVGSRRFHFCAYVCGGFDVGVRHRRTTPGAFFLGFLVVVVIADPGSRRTVDRCWPGATNNFRICGRSATSGEPAVYGPVVVPAAQPTACLTPPSSPFTPLRSRGVSKNSFGHRRGFVRPGLAQPF